jgi:uncharacterized membrane protein YphA (DoxX/SURF4 family)
MTDGLAGFERRLAAHAPATDAVARVGLGAVILLAGVHKLVDPGAWTVYVTGWLAGLLPVSPTTFMLLNGVLEPPFAVALLAGRYTALAAAFVALSLAATVLYLGVVAVASGRFVDVLIRDLGLVALAVVVAVRSADAA